MQISCPSCAAEYSVPDDKIAGRMVKCARCGEQWVPVPAGLAAPAMPMMARMHEPDPDPLPPPIPAPMRPPPPPLPMASPPVSAAASRAASLARLSAMARPAALPRPSALRMAWVASFALIAALVIGAYVGREGVMAAWPPSQRLYGVLGLR